MEDEDFMEEEDTIYEDIEDAIGHIDEALDYVRYITPDEFAVGIVEHLEAALEVLQLAREKTDVVFALDFNLDDKEFH